MAALSQTMTGQTVAPAAGSAPGTAQSDMSTEDFQKYVSGSYDELEKRINAIPNLDVSKFYAPQLAQAQAQPVAQAPPWWAQAAAAFTPNGKTPNIDNKLQQIHQDQADKDAQIAHIQQAITLASIDQEMQKGNFKKAMEQSRTLQMLKPVIDRYEAGIAMKKFKEQETLKQQGRLALASQKAADARKLLVERAKTLTKGMSIDDRLLLAQVNHIARQQEIALQRAATFDPLSETWSVNPTDFESITEDSNTNLDQWIKEHKGGSATVTPNAPVAPATTTPGSSTQVTPAERIRAAAAGH